VPQKHLTRRANHGHKATVREFETPAPGNRPRAFHFRLSLLLPFCIGFAVLDLVAKPKLMPPAIFLPPHFRSVVPLGADA
jgi:hypothetical protein